MKSKIITISVLVILVGLVTWTLVKNKKEINEKNKTVDRSEIPVSVKTYTVTEQELSGELVLPSVLQANETAVISSTSSGKIESLTIELGTIVRKGQVIGTVDSKLKNLDLKAKEISVQKLSKDYQRNKELFQGKAIQETAVIDAKYNLESTEIQASQLKQQISDANIIAPISGTIVAKNKVAGEFIGAGTQVASIADVSRLKANIYVNESEIYSLKLKQNVRLISDVFPTDNFNGSISFLSPVADENHNYLVEITLSESASKKLKAGSYVRVQMKKETQGSAITIPKKALINGTKNPEIYVAINGKSVRRKLVLGREFGEKIEVISGLQLNEKIIVEGQINIHDGSFIEISK